MNQTGMTHPVVVMLGPSRQAISGVSTHLNLIFASALAGEYSLVHFQVGSEGRNEDSIARFVRILTSPWLLAAKLFASGASIVHLNTALNARAYWRDLVYMMVAKLCGARVVYQVHGGALPQQFFGRHGVAAAFLRTTLLIPDVIAVLARSELAAYRAFLPRQRVLLLPNGVSCAVDPGRESTASTEPLRLVYIGRLAREKGLYESLLALRLVRAQGIHAQLVIAGGGSEEVPLRSLALELGLAGDVAFVGPVFGERKAKLLGDADVLLLASYAAEGLPYALLEGMAAGVPAIATPVAAIPDVIDDGVHGLLVAPRDPSAIARAIHTLASERDLLARMRKACPQRIAADYSIDRLAGELRALYADLCTAKCVKALSRL